MSEEVQTEGFSASEKAMLIRGVMIGLVAPC